MRTYCYGSQPPTENAEIVRQQLERAHRYYNDRIAFLREEAVARARASVIEDKTAKNAALGAAHRAMLAAEREVRAHCGLHCGTYLQVEDATRKAASMCAVVAAKKEGQCPRCKAPFVVEDLITIHAKKKMLLGCCRCVNGPRMRRWDGSGLLAVQLQYGRTAEDLLVGEDLHARIVGAGKHRILMLRVGTGEKRAPIWAHFPVAWHRDLPAEARAKWVRCCVHRCGTHDVWSAQFVLEAPPESFAIASPMKGAIAADVGWRDFGPAGLRVATWIDDSGAQGELRLPRAMLDRDQKVSDLRSIRDKNFGAERDWLVDERRVHKDEWPAWLRAETRSLHQWRAPAKLAALTVRWRTRWESEHEGERFDASDRSMAEPLLSRLEAWRKQDKHLLEWESHQREAIIRERRELYRLFARQLATYRRVVVERLPLDELAEVDEEPEQRLTHNSRAHRFDAGLSYLLDYAADAVHRAGGDFSEMDPAMTTQWCHGGDHEERFDAAQSVMHDCSCGRSWDQDRNAARNMLSPPPGLLAWQAAREAQCSPKTAHRSRLKVADPTKETGAAAWRRKGLERRRAGRSKTEAQQSENTSDAT